MKVSDFVKAAMAVGNVTFYDRSGNIVKRPNLAGIT